MSSIGKDFIKKTSFQFLEPSKQMQGYPSPPLELDYDKSKTLINLPRIENIEVKKLDLRKAIEVRKSIRNYKREPIGMDELSFMLWATQGVKEAIPPHATLRTVPSAGARHAFETYLLINDVAGIQPGLYRYLALEHKLVELNLKKNIADVLEKEHRR